jgi:hypothetical protein
LSLFFISSNEAVVLSMGKETEMVVSIVEELLSADAAKKFLKPPE